MLRRTHGFDLCDGNGAVLFFDSYEASFMQDSMVTGRDGLGQAIWLFNTAFGEADFLDELDPQPIWGFHMDYQMSGTVVGGASPEMEFYRIYNDTGTPIMSLYQRGDGLMEIWNNGGGGWKRSGRSAALRRDTPAGHAAARGLFPGLYPGLYPRVFEAETESLVTGLPRPGPGQR